MAVAPVVRMSSTKTTVDIFRSCRVADFVTSNRFCVTFNRSSTVRPDRYGVALVRLSMEAWLPPVDCHLWANLEQRNAAGS